MSSDYLLGVDIGTYSSKGVLVDAAGVVLATRVVEHKLEIPHPGWAEHDAELAWWGDFVTIIGDLLASSGVPAQEIAAIGVSAISPAVLPIDRSGCPLRKAILYGVDVRATREIDLLQSKIDADPSLSAADVHLSSQSSAPKVLWIREHEPAVWTNTYQLVDGTGFILYRLTHSNVMSVYNAASFQPFVDLATLSWRPETEKYLAPLAKLPRIRWTCEIAGHVSAEGAKLSGLAEGTAIIAGAADAAAEAISAGLADIGDMMVMYGSSIFFILRTAGLLPSPHFWTAPFLELDSYALMGGMATAGSLTRWFRDQFAPLEVHSEHQGGPNSYEALANLADTSAPGANGLVMLPYFSGERTPLLDPHAKGMIFGLGLSHTRGDVYRCLLESVGFGIRHNLEIMRADGAEPKRLLAVGGGTQNRLWMQVVSDITGAEQYIPEKQIGASYGDAFLAGIGAGIFSCLSDARQWMRVGRVIEPDREHAQAYQGYYEIYRSLYTQNARSMKRIDSLIRA